MSYMYMKMLVLYLLKWLIHVSPTFLKSNSRFSHFLKIQFMFLPQVSNNRLA